MLAVYRDIHKMPTSFNLKYQWVIRPRLSQALAKARSIVDEVAVDLMDNISGLELTIAR
jgi:hypothetical protein